MPIESQDSVRSLTGSLITDNKSPEFNKQVFDELFKDSSDGFGTIRESRVSKKFQEMTTKRIVSIVLVCIMVTPFLSADLYLETNHIADYVISVFKIQPDYKDLIQFDKPCAERQDLKTGFQKLKNLESILMKIEEYQDLYNSEIIDVTMLNCSSETYVPVYVF